LGKEYHKKYHGFITHYIVTNNHPLGYLRRCEIFSRHVIFIIPTFFTLIKINTPSLSILTIILQHKEYQLKSSRLDNFHLKSNYPKNFHFESNHLKNFYLESNYPKNFHSESNYPKNVHLKSNNSKNFHFESSHPKNFHAPCINVNQCPCIITTHLA